MLDLQFGLLLFERLDLFVDPGQRIPFDVRDLRVEPAVSQDHSHQAENGGDEIGLLLVELLPLERTLRHEVHFHRALGDVAQSQAHHFAIGMGDFGQFFQVDGGIDLDVAERIEVFDRQIEFFREELRGVRHDRRAAGEEQALRRRTTLLPAIELERLVDLNVQARHDLARNLRDRRLLRVVRFLVSATEADKTLLDLEPFGLREFQLGLRRKILSDGVGADIDAARIDLALLKKQQVAGLGANVQQHGAAVEVAIVVAKRVAQSGGRYVHQLHAQPRRFRRAKETLHHVRLDGDEQHFQFTGRRRSQDLIVPDHFFQREGHVLLSFVLDDLGDLGSVHRRQFDKLGKNVKAGRADVDVFRAERPLGEQFLDRLEDDPFTRGFLRALEAERL